MGYSSKRGYLLAALFIVLLALAYQSVLVSVRVGSNPGALVGAERFELSHASHAESKSDTKDGLSGASNDNEEAMVEPRQINGTERGFPHASHVESISDTKDGLSRASNDNEEAMVEPRQVDGRGVYSGILSTKPTSFFRAIQKEIDEDDKARRCKRYSFKYNPNKKKRRIFFGAMIADETWELYNIVATEAYGLYHAVVLVEGKRTQNFSPRKFKHIGNTKKFQELFGIENVQVRAFVDERKRVQGLVREHLQREEIVKGWKEMGMGPTDIGLLADIDETFTRDFLQAVLTCDKNPFLDYASYQCHYSRVKLRGIGQVFESTPDCITFNRMWFHPDMVLGACIEGIADKTIHPNAPREGFRRAQGYGRECTDWDGYNLINDGHYFSANAADFRRLCSGRMGTLNVASNPGYAKFTAYHFHNFFTSLNATRFKYLTYGHPNGKADKASLSTLNNDSKMLFRCVRNLTHESEQKWWHELGGFKVQKPFLPIYFQDEEYVRRRHSYVVQEVELDASVYGS